MYIQTFVLVGIIIAIGYWSTLEVPLEIEFEDKTIVVSEGPRKEFNEEIIIWPTGSLALIMAIISAGIIINTSLYTPTKHRDVMNLLLLGCIFKASVDDLYVYKFNLIIYISSIVVYHTYLQLINEKKDLRFLIIPAITFIGSSGYYLYGKNNREFFMFSDVFYLLMIFITPIALLMAESYNALALLAVTSLIVYDQKFSMF